MFFYNLLRSGASAPQILMLALAFILSAVSAIIIHENMHGLVAHWFGDDTAKNRGRLTLNPLAHFDALGIFMFLFVGFGWAKPVPVDPRNFKNEKLGMILVSVAGVLANFVLAGIGLLLLYVLYPFIAGGMMVAGTNGAGYILLYFVMYLLIYGIEINFMLGFFNLLPIYPLDGFNLINSFLPAGNPFGRFMRRYGSYILLALILVGQVSSAFHFEYLDIFAQFNNLIYDMIIRVVTASVGG